MFRTSYKIRWSLLIIFLSFLSDPIFCQINLQNLILDRQDPSYGGYYLDIDFTMKSLGISRLFAHEIQNQMRDELETLSSSYSIIRQKPFLNSVIKNAVDNVTQRYHEEGMFKPLELRDHEFILAISLEGTLLSQWHQRGRGSGANREGDLTVSIPDSVPSLLHPDSGDSLPRASLKFSSSSIQLRPGLRPFFRAISQLPEFMGFVIFTRKQDHAAWALLRAWKKVQPELFKELLGFYTRNYLRFDTNLDQPAKDLRIFDPTLRHILSLDSFEDQILQPHLNFKVPAFGADAYLKGLKEPRRRRVRAINKGLLPFIATQIQNCVLKVKQGSYGRQLHYCFQAEMGTLSSKAGSEAFLYLETLEEHLPIPPLKFLEFFHQETYVRKRQTISDPFPQYLNFQEIHPSKMRIPLKSP
jgi:hypothetical protein